MDWEGRRLSDTTLVPSPPLQGKYSKRKGRFKRSDGSTSSDTTSNSFVRQVTGKRAWEMQPTGAGCLATFSGWGGAPFSRHLSPAWNYHTRRPVTSLHLLLPPLLHQLPAPAACLPACVISFRDSLACLLLACFGLSPTPPAGCLLPCPPPESVVGWG